LYGSALLSCAEEGRSRLMMVINVGKVVTQRNRDLKDRCTDLDI
jgi:hypothetical protein